MSSSTNSSSTSSRGSVDSLSAVDILGVLSFAQGIVTLIVSLVIVFLASTQQFRATRTRFRDDAFHATFQIYKEAKLVDDKFRTELEDELKAVSDVMSELHGLFAVYSKLSYIRQWQRSKETAEELDRLTLSLNDLRLTLQLRNSENRVKAMMELTRNEILADLRQVLDQRDFVRNVSMAEESPSSGA